MLNANIILQFSVVTPKLVPSGVQRVDRPQLIFLILSVNKDTAKIHFPNGGCEF